MIYQKGNILDVTHGVICHQVNCMGVMGAGLAKQIKEKYPQVYKRYRQAYYEGELQLGHVVFADTGNGVLVANICGQWDYGKNVAQVYTSYDALRTGIQRVHILSTKLGIPAYVPHGIGCGLAGGDWSKVNPILQVNLPEGTVVSFN
jgi:O-acetyl-ADP-ribose deacetylase (regulator of RNase III)